MAINPIEAATSLDLSPRESPGGAIRAKRNTVKPSAAPAPAPAATPDQAEDPAPAETVQQGPISPNLKFSTDEKTGKTVVAVVDPTGKVLRQMPSDEALKVAEQIGRFQGMFVDLKA